MLIEYTEPRIHVVRGSVGVEFEFRPGAENDVPAEIWEDLKKNSIGTRALLASGKLKPVTVRMLASKSSSAVKGDGHVSDNVAVGDKLPPKGRTARKPMVVEEQRSTDEPVTLESIKAADITRMTSWDATDFIKKIFTEKTLERFRADENAKRGGPRKQVIQAIDEQLSIMRTDPTQGSSSSLAAEA